MTSQTVGLLCFVFLCGVGFGGLVSYVWGKVKLRWGGYVKSHALCLDREGSDSFDILCSRAHKTPAEALNKAVSVYGFVVEAELENGTFYLDEAEVDFGEKEGAKIYVLNGGRIDEDDQVSPRV